MPDDSNLPPGNPFAGSPPLDGAPKPPVDPAGNQPGGAGAQVGADAGDSGEPRPPKPPGGPGKGNTWAWLSGAWKRVKKEPGELTPEAERAIKSAGWAGEKVSSPSPGSAPSAQPAAVPDAFVFLEADNRAFLDYALNSLEGLDKADLEKIAEEMLAGTRYEDKADGLAERFHNLSKASPDEREALIGLFLDFLREVQFNIPKSARGVWAALNIGFRKRDSRKQLRAELAALKGAA